MFKTSKTKFFLFIISSLILAILLLQLGPQLVQAREPSIDNYPKEISLTNAPQVKKASTGLISGKLSFPSEHIPALTIFAIRKDNGLDTFYAIQTDEGQSSYSIRVDPGVYNVLAYAGELAGGYTRYVKCGMGAGCQDHTLASAVVEPGAILSWVDIYDWYAPAGTFPDRPDGETTSETTTVCSTYHTVKSGENLFRIGLQYDLTWKPIAAANRLANPNLIYAGQVLCIPGQGRVKPQVPETNEVPTIEIVSVVKDKQVIIKSYDFPADTDFIVTMGMLGTRGINGLRVALTNSGDGDTFKATYSIPEELRGQGQIAIRLESASGYYSYNWFYNNTTN